MDERLREAVEGEKLSTLAWPITHERGDFLAVGIALQDLKALRFRLMIYRDKFTTMQARVIELEAEMEARKEAATERDTLEKALEVAVKALHEISGQCGQYIGCRCPSEENGGMGDCWPCRMIMIGFIPQEALSEIERIKGAR